MKSAVVVDEPAVEVVVEEAAVTVLVGMEPSVVVVVSVVSFPPHADSTATTRSVGTDVIRLTR